MYKAVITTSANPFHFGHLHVYKMAEKIFGQNNVLCLIAKNSSKNVDLQKIKYHMTPYNINYEIIEDMAVADYCKNNNIEFIVRGIRNGVDAEYELKIDFINKQINQNLQTIYVPTSDTFSNISSSVIRELILMKKFDIIHKFMNVDAYRRYIQSKPKYVVFYGMSCVGKSTYLEKHRYNTINIDKFIWEVVESFEGIDGVQKHKKNLNEMIQNDDYYGFQKYLQDQLAGNKKFWNKFFMMIDSKSNSELIFLDFAAIGNYWYYIDDYYKSQIKLVCIDTTKSKRIANIINRAGERNLTVNELSKRIETLDKIYQPPPYCDEIIKI